MRLQPDEAITLSFGAKVPRHGFDVRSVSMDFLYGAAFPEPTHDAYERLLLDAVRGDPTLFIRSDEVMRAWQIVEPVQAAMAEGRLAPQPYPAGSWGPEGADELLRRTGRQWRRP
jgi:glucose-6-phosphate 1-dehydrogenase